VEHPKSSAEKPVRCEPLFLNLTNWQGNVIDLIGEHGSIEAITVDTNQWWLFRGLETRA
jgi:hypothetical protein